MTFSEQQKVILVGWDHGERPRDALALAGVLARELGLGIRLGHVYEIYPAYPPYTDLSESAREVAQRLLDSAPTDDLGDIAVDRALIAAHSPSAGLHKLAEATDVEMVVLGSTHRGAIGRAVPGTVAAHLLHGCPHAVAIAPAGYVQQRRPSLHTITAAYDASPEGRVALEEATRIAQSSGAKLRIVSAVEPVHYYEWMGASTMTPPDLGTIATAGRRRELDEVVANRPAELECEDVLRQGDAADVIAGESSDSDLLVMGSRGYGPVRSVLLGSVSHAVLRNATCPVLVIPRSAAAEQVEQPARQAAAVT